MPLEERGKIDDVEVQGSWGVKIDFLIRHLKHWKRKDAEARIARMHHAETTPDTSAVTKHIVFSARAGSLDIVKAAFQKNRISFMDYVTGGRTTLSNQNALQAFKSDFTQVFLLNGERQVSGLTLTAATVVHLLEPVINQGYELQAIGRVDRGIGQTRPTTVFCYSTEKTIEAKIVNRSLAANHCIYAKNTPDIKFSAEDTTAKVVKGAGGLTGDHNDLLDLLL